MYENEYLSRVGFYGLSKKAAGAQMDDGLQTSLEERVAREKYDKAQARLESIPYGGGASKRTVMDWLSNMGVRGRGTVRAIGKMDPGVSTANMATYVMNDLSDELETEQGNLADKIYGRLPSYGLWGLGGAGLGAWIGGPKHRWSGAAIGGVGGLLANYLRRKTYYGKNITL